MNMKKTLLAMLLALASLPVFAQNKTEEVYVIGATDVLQISVWKEPDVSTTVTVRPDGRISMPLVEEIQAAGETPVALGKTITERLSKYISNPKVTVVVTQPNSHKIYVVGQVLRPGSYTMTPNMTVLQAISSAGGVNELGNGKKTVVLRNENGKQVKYPFNYNNALKGDIRQQLELKAGDTILVP
jgi:polysaccharide biosynthesis/export protein